MLTQQKEVTKEEFYRFVALPENRDRNFEFIAGEIVEVVSNNESSEAAARLMAYFGGHVLTHKLGRITGADGGYVINGEDYIPDAAFMSFKRQPIRPNKVAYNPVAPDLAIEVLSLGNSAKEIATKIVNYMAAGTVLWLVDLETETIDVWIPSQPVKRLRIGDILDGGDVLPGFTLPVSELFA